MKLPLSSFIISLIFVLFLINGEITIISSDTSTTSEIFYYSETQQAFIREDVLGTRTNELISYQIPKDCYSGDNCRIIGPGWSPSGRWLAWTIDNVFGSPPQGAVVNVFNIESNTASQITNLQQPSFDLQWSPWSDSFIFGIYDIEDNSAKKYFVWEASQNVSMQIPIQGNPLTTYWSPNGQIISYSVRQDDTYIMSVYYQNAILIDEIIFSPITTSISSLSRCLPAWSIDNRVLYISPEGLLITRLFNSSFETPQLYDFSENYLIEVIWSHDAEYGLIYASQECGNSGLPNSIWLLSLLDQTLTRLGTGPLLMARFNDDSFTSQVWSPNDEQAIFILNEGEELEIALFDTSNNRLVSLGNLNWISRYRSEWVDSQNVIFSAPNETSTTSLFQLNVETLSVNELMSVNDFDLSPRRDQIILTNFEDCRSFCFYNLDPVGESLFVPEVESLLIPWDYFWHESGEWILLTTERVGAYYTIVISDNYGNNVRVLQERHSLEPSALGWMPD